MLKRWELGIDYASNMLPPTVFPRINVAAFINLFSAELWRLFEGGVYKSRYIAGPWHHLLCDSHPLPLNPGYAPGELSKYLVAI